MNTYVGVNKKYTPLEKITTTGNQFINTKFNTTENTKIEIQVKFNETNVNQILFCSRLDTSSEMFMLTKTSSSNQFNFAIGGSNSNFTTTTDTTSIYTFLAVKSEKAIYKNGTKIFTSTYAGAINPVSPVYLFTAYRQGQMYSFATFDFYYCKIWDNDVLVRNLIPVIDEQGITCLFDLVENQFYYNGTETAFIPGQVSGSTVSLGSKAQEAKTPYVGIEASYTPVKYIANVGGTQFINTEVIPNFTTGFKFEVKYIPWQLGNRYSLINNFGDAKRTGFNNSRYICFEVTANNESRAVLYCDNSSMLDNKIAGVVEDTENTAIYEYYNGNYKHSLNGTETTGTYTASGATYSEALLFVDTALRFSTFPVSIRLCSVKIWEGDTLTRHFIPVKDQNDVVCMFDLVNSKFYYNCGTGTFTAGTVTGSTVTLSNYPKRVKQLYVGVNGVAQKGYKANLPSTATCLFHFNEKNIKEELKKCTVVTPVESITKTGMVPGKFGNGGYCFNGSANNNDWFPIIRNVGYNETDLLNHNLTITFWLRSKSYNPTSHDMQVIPIYFKAYASATNPSAIFDSTSSNIRLNTEYCSPQTQVAMPNIKDCAWHYFALVIRNGSVQLYIDGLKSSYGTVPSNCRAILNNLYFSIANTSWYIDEFMVCREALYTDEFTPPTKEWNY